MSSSDSVSVELLSRARTRLARHYLAAQAHHTIPEELATEIAEAALGDNIDRIIDAGVKLEQACPLNIRRSIS